MGPPSKAPSSVNIIKCNLFMDDFVCWRIVERLSFIKCFVFSSGLIIFLLLSLSFHCHISTGHILLVFITLSPRNNMSLRVKPLFLLTFKPLLCMYIMLWLIRPRYVFSILPFSIDLSLSLFENDFFCASSRTMTFICFFPRNSQIPSSLLS